MENATRAPSSPRIKRRGRRRGVDRGSQATRFDLSIRGREAAPLGKLLDGLAHAKSSRMDPERQSQLQHNSCRVAPRIKRAGKLWRAGHRLDRQREGLRFVALSRPDQAGGRAKIKPAVDERQTFGIFKALNIEAHFATAYNANGKARLGPGFVRLKHSASALKLTPATASTRVRNVSMRFSPRRIASRRLRRSSIAWPITSPATTRGPITIWMT